MGPLLRGPIDDEEIEGPKKERLIIGACERDKWPASVIACVASATEPTVFDCLHQLPENLVAQYEKAIANFGVSKDHEDMPPPEEETTCDEAFTATAVDLWPPAVEVAGERALAAKLRLAPLRRLCDDKHWGADARRCVSHTPADGIEICLEMLGNARSSEVDDTIKEADALRAKIVKAQAKPTAVSCDKVVAAHYATAKWTGKAPELKGSARTKAIATSKKAMLGACKAGWAIDTRACVIADDRDSCYSMNGIGPSTWGYPAAAAMPSTLPKIGMAECDEYADSVQALATCTSLPEETRTALIDAYKQTAEAWKSVPPEGQEALRTACKAAADAIKQVAQTCT
jgi:hypothetical protein